MDKIAEFLGISPETTSDYDLDALFNEYKIINFDPEISRKEALLRNAEIVSCDKCGVVGNRPNMMRWHFENCKTEFRQCQQCDNQIPRQGIKDFLYNQKKYCNRSCYMKSKIGKAPIIMTEEIKAKLRRPKKCQIK